LGLAEKDHRFANHLNSGDNVMQPNGSPKKTIYLFLFGDLDDAYSEKLHQQLESLSSQYFDEVVFNLSNVTAFTKPAIDQFMDFYHSAVATGKSIRIQGINDYVVDLFQTLHLEIPIAM
jgi:anti-anti-sigma regulatory factor